ncbi:MAG: hypothetical protein M1152_01215 [Actinobacteria bacterium]|nr:hypothetical protein [Actinomycetota bacterium]
MNLQKCKVCAKCGCGEASKNRYLDIGPRSSHSLDNWGKEWLVLRARLLGELHNSKSLDVGHVRDAKS